MKRLLLLLLFLATALSAQGIYFDETAAFELLEEQVAFGSRAPGTKGNEECEWWLIEQLDKYCDELTLHRFDYTSPTGGHSFELTNIIGIINPDAPRRIMLGAHWDTRLYADEDPDPANRELPVPGANDGASGVAVLLELARVFSEYPPEVGILFVLFDGEDQGHIDRMPFCLGSEMLAASGMLRYDYGIVIDLVGDADLNLPQEGHSLQMAPSVVELVWGVAAELGESVFSQGAVSLINDDHLPFLERGYPTIDIIDLDYDYWHTVDDLPENCSAASLGSVGRVVETVIRREPA